MKRCPRCCEIKDESAFHRNRSTRSGRQTYYHPCQLAVNREWKERNPEVSRAAARRHRGSKRHVPLEQDRAKSSVQRALKKGVLTRPAVCPRCGKDDSPIHAHHTDYQKPLEIEWLCARCHGRRHAEIRGFAT